MRVLDRYIRKTIYAAIALVVLILLGIQSFLQLVQEFRHIGQAQYGVLNALLFVPMQLPAQFYQLFPMAGFLGCLIGLGRLATSSQLIVMRASGVSIFRIAASVLKAAIPLVVIVTLLGEWVGPAWQQQSMAMRQHALHENKQVMPTSVWMHEGHVYAHVAQITSPKTIKDIVLYRFDDHKRLVSATYAKTGELLPDGRWRLFDLSQTLFSKRHTKVVKKKTMIFNLLLKPNLQVQAEMSAAEQSMLSLYRAIQYRHEIGLSSNQLVYALIQRMLQPLTTIVMICLGVPFVFGSLRSATIGVKVLIGVVIGFVFYMLNQLFGPVTLIYQFPPLLAAILPTLFFTMILIILLVRVK